MRAGHSYIHTNKLTCMHTYINTYGVKEKQMSHLPLTNPPTPPPPIPASIHPPPATEPCPQRYDNESKKTVTGLFFLFFFVNKKTPT